MTFRFLVSKYGDEDREDKYVVTDATPLTQTTTITDSADAGYMERNSQLKAVKQFIESQNICSVERPNEILYNQMGFWQRTVADKSELLVYSAFYDDRPAVDLTPVIRVLGVSTNQTDQIYCHIWYDFMKKPYVIKAEVIKSGRGDSVKKVFYGQYLFSCSLPGAQPIPTYVSMTFGKCEKSTIYLPIFLPVRSQYKAEFGICVPISYGNINKQDFIEWMELNHILGISEVHIYNGTLDASLHSLFQMYRDENRLFVHSMPPPKDVPTMMGSKLGSPASINDCMLRFMYRYKYIISIDFDEFIIPRTTLYLHDMLNKARKYHKIKEDHPIYTFHNSYFHTNFKKSGKSTMNLRSLDYVKSLKPNPVPDFVKSIVDPRKCLSLFNHYCWVQFPEYSQHRYYAINDTIARSHHYKICYRNCKEQEAHATVDRTIEKYRDSLTTSVQNRLKLYSIRK